MTMDFRERHFLRLAAAATLVAALGACARKPMSHPEAAPGATQDKAADPSPLNPLGTVTLRDFRGIHAAYSAITGIDTAQSPSTKVQTAFESARANLPQATSADSYSAAALRQLVTLASTFCDELTTKEAALAQATRAFYQGIDFTKGPDAQAATARDQAVTTLATRFWGRPPEADEKATLVQLFSETGTTNDGAETRRRLLLVCTAVASSLATIQI